jgi:His-Xaa-Ser repeat protein HxsA
MNGSSTLWKASAVSLAILMAGCSSTSWNNMSKADKGTAGGATGGAVAGAVVGGPVGAVAGAGIGAYAGNYAGAKSDPAHPGEGTMGKTAEARDASAGAPQRTAQADSARTAMTTDTSATPATNRNLPSTDNGTANNLSSGSDNGMRNGTAMTNRSTAGATTAMQDEATVRQAQEALLKAGYDPGPIDGVMGPRTEQALSRFQQAKGLSGSTSLDTQTLSALGVSP